MATSRTLDGKMPGESKSTPREIQNYLGRISGPLLDRIDLHIEVPPVKFREISGERSGETSAHIRERVIIDPEILQARVPTLILQPLVENAIRHGIEAQAGVGTIAIHATREGSQIKLSVSDNGKNPFNAAVLAKNRQGIGLANTRARLQQLYGKEQSFAVGESELGGWTVEIKIPFCPAPITKATA
jgi:hypothetical protein